MYRTSPAWARRALRMHDRPGPRVCIHRCVWAMYVYMDECDVAFTAACASQHRDRTAAIHVACVCRYVPYSGTLLTVTCQSSYTRAVRPINRLHRGPIDRQRDMTSAIGSVLYVLCEERAVKGGGGGRTNQS